MKRHAGIFNPPQTPSMQLITAKQSAHNNTHMAHEQNVSLLPVCGVKIFRSLENVEIQFSRKL